jgi:RHS repeat-associated protein
LKAQLQSAAALPCATPQAGKLGATIHAATNSVVKSTAYAYNFHGGVTSITYPSGRTVNYAYNAAGQTLSAIDTANSITYASNAAYNAPGSLTSLQEGANLITTAFYTPRLQPCRISVKNTGSAPSSCADTTTGNVMDFTYGFNYGAADNGNVASIANNITNGRSQSFTYDELNRVSTALTQATSVTYCWGEVFGYDAWANLKSINHDSAHSASGCGTAPLSVTPYLNNRLTDTGFGFDAAGNMTSDPVNSSPNSYTFNAEGELTSAAGVNYTYDGDGSRVKKSSGKLYWYGNGIDPLSESDASGNLRNEYIFLSGKRIAMLQLSSSTVNYYIADHLGSSRIVTNSSGSILDDSDFYPYGGERSYSSGSGNNYKFTGKERDAESRLDDFAARFYTSNYGRFLSADDAKYAHAPDPQTWNLYTYVANNPLNAVDPTGHEVDPLLADANANQYKPMEHSGYIDQDLGSGATVTQPQAEHKKYVLLVGDQDSGGTHDAGKAFQMAAETMAAELRAEGNEVIIQRVSSIQDFNAALTNNGAITGGVVYFGHSGLVPSPNGGMTLGLAVGEKSGADTNITKFNVGSLDGKNLGPNATITLLGCSGGYSDKNNTAIAQFMANQLNRNVSASQNPMFFSNDRTSVHSTQGAKVATKMPMYVLPEGGGGLTLFKPQH